jgi:fatty acid desaturase
LFRSKWPHAFVGLIAGFFSLIPFYNWKRIHGRHHKWTGWQDVDPTTASLVPRPLGRVERALVNVCWRCWIPLFSLIYRVNNFWNMPRLRSLFTKPQERRRFAVSSIALLATYVVIVALIGPATALRSAGAGLLLAFVAEDVLILSQHTHIPLQISHGEPVRPFPTIEQEAFTRSLVFPRWISALLLHIMSGAPPHAIRSCRGIASAASHTKRQTKSDCGRGSRGRALPGEVLLFHNRLETGATSDPTC